VGVVIPVSRYSHVNSSICIFSNCTASLSPTLISQSACRYSPIHLLQDVEKCKKHMVEAHKLEIGVISDSPAAIVLDLDFSSQTENTGDPAATLLSVGKDADTIISGREERPDGKVSMSTQVSW